MIAKAVPWKPARGEAAPVQRLPNRGRSASGGCISRCARKSSQGQAWHTTHGKVTIITEILQGRVKTALSPGHHGGAMAICTDLTERAQKTRKTTSQIVSNRRFDN